MANLQEIRRRISSVRSTQKITRAMKMVAASKLRRAQEAVLCVRPYAYHMRDITKSLISQVESPIHPLLEPRTGHKVGLVVVTADRGLCGAFNANVVNETMRLLRDRFAGKEVALTVVGRKGVEALQRRLCTIRRTHIGVFDRYSPNVAVRIADELADDFIHGDTAEVYCAYNEFKGAVSQRVALERFLPYELSPQKTAAQEYYIFEPSIEEILLVLLRQNLHAQMHRILSEASAAEHAARMAAMEGATRNAEDVIGRLTLTYNRVRQDAITKEVVEVVSGAEAL